MVRSLVWLCDISLKVSLREDVSGYCGHRGGHSAGCQLLRDPQAAGRDRLCRTAHRHHETITSIRVSIIDLLTFETGSCTTVRALTLQCFPCLSLLMGICFSKQLHAVMLSPCSWPVPSPLSVPSFCNRFLFVCLLQSIAASYMPCITA